MTLQLLWEEYRSEHPSGYGYTQFAQYYHRWKQTIDVTLRQRYVAGEKVFVDWAGDTLEWIDQATGEVHTVSLFVAVLGASTYTYAEALPTTSCPTGSKAMSTPSSISVGSAVWWFLTTNARA